MKKQLSLPLDIQAKLQSWYVSDSIPDSEIESTMRNVWKENRYLICPHTACAVKAAERHPSPHHIVCLATAHPAKFAESVTRICGVSPFLPFGLQFTRNLDLEKVDYSKFPALTVSRGKTASETLNALKNLIDSSKNRE